MTNFKNVRFQGENAGNINYSENWHFDGFLMDAKNDDLKLKIHKGLNNG
jgi:hypothetical protein